MSSFYRLATYLVWTNIHGVMTVWLNACWLAEFSKRTVLGTIRVRVRVGGAQEKMSFFQIASGPILSITIYLNTCLYGPCKFSLKKNDPFLTYEPPKVSVFSFSPANKFTCFLSRFQKSENMHMDHFKYVKLLLYIFERRVQSFGTKLWREVGQQGCYSGGGPR